MALLLFFLSFLLIAFFILQIKPRWLKFGKFKKAKTLSSAEQCYYIEEVSFEGRQQAIHGYFKIVPMIFNHQEALEVQYDFFDFFNIIIRFPNYTIKLVRRLDDVRLIKSEKPISIQDFEQQTQAFSYQVL